MKHAGFSQIFYTLIIASLFVAFISVIYFSQPKNTPSTPIFNYSPQPTKPLVPSIALQNYTNPTFNYSINYPDTYEILSQTSKQKSQLGPGQNICLAKKGSNTCQLIFNAFDNVDIFKNQPPITVAERQVLDSGLSYRITESVLNGYKTASIVLSDSNDKNDIFIAHPTANLFIEIVGTTPDFTQIISTFKFTDSKAVSEAGKHIGIVKNIYENNGKKYLTIDYIELLTGEAGGKACIEDAKCEKDCLGSFQSYCLPNDYYIRNNNDKIRTFEISPQAIIKDLHPDNVSLANTTFPRFKSYFDRKQSSDIYNIAVNSDNIITSITQWFHP